MQNTAISKDTLNGSVLAMVISSINGLNNVEIQANDAHGMAISEALLLLRCSPQFGRNILSGNTNNLREVKLYRV